MRGKQQKQRGAGRGWGPFSGAQLTVIVVAVVIVVGLPVVASAASAVFTSNKSGTPALKATNSAANGVGVSATGKKFGVLSNGPLGVAAGKTLSCAGCVTPGDLSSAAKQIQVLPSGKTESGMYAAGGAKDAGTDYIGTGITYPRPLATAIPDNHVIDTAAGANAHCPAPGSADQGYLCLYGTYGVSSNFNVSAGYGYSSGNGEQFSTPSVGANLFWPVTGTGPYVYGEYTVTAP